MIELCWARHAGAKVDLTSFLAFVENVRPWHLPSEIGHDLLIGECPGCKSTLAIEVPSACAEVPHAV